MWDRVDEIIEFVKEEMWVPTETVVKPRDGRMELKITLEDPESFALRNRSGGFVAPPSKKEINRRFGTDNSVPETAEEMVELIQESDVIVDDVIEILNDEMNLGDYESGTTDLSGSMMVAPLREPFDSHKTTVGDILDRAGRDAAIEEVMEEFIEEVGDQLDVPDNYEIVFYSYNDYEGVFWGHSDVEKTLDEMDVDAEEIVRELEEEEDDDKYRMYSDELDEEMDEDG